MEISKLSAANQALLNSSKKQTAQKPVQEQKKDITFKGRTDKKVFYGVAALAAAGIVAAASIKGFKPIRVLKLEKEATKLMLQVQNMTANIPKNAQQIFNQAEKNIDYVTKLFKNNGIKDSKQIAQIFEDASDKSIQYMDEMAGDKLVRRSKFSLGKLSSIEEYLENSKTNKYLFEDGVLTEFGKNFEKSAQNVEDIQEVFLFQDGNFVQFQKGWKKLADTTEKIDEMSFFQDGKLIEYQKDFTQFPDGKEQFMSSLRFKDGKISEYQKNHEVFPTEAEKIQEILGFQDGKVYDYFFEYIMPPENSLVSVGWAKHWSAKKG